MVGTQRHIRRDQRGARGSLPPEVEMWALLARSLFLNRTAMVRSNNRALEGPVDAQAKTQALSEHAPLIS